jgi:hypothetical protein
MGWNKRGSGCAHAWPGVAYGLGTALLSTWLLESTGRAASAAVTPQATAEAALAVATGRAVLKDFLPAHVAVFATKGTTMLFARTAIIVAVIGLALGLGAAGIVTTISSASVPAPVLVPQPASQPAGAVAPKGEQKDVAQPGHAAARRPTRSGQCLGS